MNFTSTEWILIIGAIFLGLQNTLTSWRQTAKLDATLNKASIIEGHVNSKETKYVEEIASLKRENDILKGVIADKDRIAALLAQSVTSRMRNADISSEPQDVNVINPKNDPVNVKQGAK